MGKQRRREERKKEAIERQEKRDELTTREQLDIIFKRRGTSRRERDRLGFPA